MTKRTRRIGRIGYATGAVLAVLLLPGCRLGVDAQPKFVEQGGPSTTPTDRADSQPQLMGHDDPSPSTADPTSSPVGNPGRTPAVAANVTIRNVTELVQIPYPTRDVDDATMDEGVRRVLTMGVPGVKTLTYRVTFVGARQTDKMLVSSVITKKPVGAVVAVGTRPSETPQRDCNANYSGCVPVAVDVDCAGGGNGPVYQRSPVKVVGIDIYHLDLDNDGRACSGPNDIP